MVSVGCLRTGTQNQKNFISSRTRGLPNTVLVDDYRFGAVGVNGACVEIPGTAKRGRPPG